MKMNINNILVRNRKFLFITFLSVFVALISVVFAVQAATIIGNNVSVGGTLSVNGDVTGPSSDWIISPNGAYGLTLGSSSTTALTITTDGTGTGEVVLPVGAIDSTEILDGTIADADISGSAAISLSKLAGIPDGNILVGPNGGGSPTAVAMSGDATINNTGALTIANGAVNSAKILDGTITDTDVSSSAAISLSKLVGIPDGNILVGPNGGGSPTAVAMTGDATINNTGALTIANGAVNQAKLSYETATVNVTPAASSGTTTVTSGDAILGYYPTTNDGKVVDSISISSTTLTLTVDSTSTATSTFVVTLLKS